MAFSRFSEPTVAKLIERFSQADRLTIIVGAGVSRESELPGWDKLIRRLLARVYSETHDKRSSQLADLWADEACKTHGVVAAGEIVATFASTHLADWVDKALYETDKKGEGALYEGKPTKSRAPGHIARQVARLRRQYRTRLRIVTTNYDKLIETALREEGFSRVHARVSSSEPPSGHAVVDHLHGYLHSSEGRKTLVLTESQYLRLQTADQEPWQETLMKDALGKSDCLFVGASLTDPNLIRYLHANPPRRPVAVFVRQGDHADHFVQSPQVCPLQQTGIAGDISIELAKDLEAAYVARWKSCNVTPVFLDHYGDVAQLLYEISFMRFHGSNYAPLSDRMTEWIRNADDQLLGLKTREAFEESQRTLNKWLTDIVSVALEAIGMTRASLKDETVELALWLVDSEGKTLRNVGNSDRLQTNAATMMKAPLGTEKPWEPSPWICVNAYARGTLEYGAPDVYSSQWRVVLGIPLTPEQSSIPSIGRLPVGCLTLASTSIPRQSFLRRLPEKKRIDFQALLQQAGEDFLMKAVSAPVTGA